MLRNLAPPHRQPLMATDPQLATMQRQSDPPPEGDRLHAVMGTGVGHPAVQDSGGDRPVP
ncbi:MAG: hypothetical protein DI600_01685 [Cutibacterium granulosum]|nr:MAG: hypothetical protein DI600_01685 [Cutibacterium granulosum]